MEFWGIELKGDKPVKVQPDEFQVVHLSQATLVDTKKGNSDSVTIFANIGGKKLAIGVLNADKFPQVSFDLVFEKEFELSHNSKNGNVHLTGYKSEIQEEDDDEDISEFDEDEMAATLGVNRPNGVAPALAVAPKSKAAAPAKDNKTPSLLDSDSDASDDDDSDEADSEDDSDASDKVMAEAEAGSDDSDDSEDSEEEKEDTPVKPVVGKKRSNSAAKTPDTKKAKLVTPQKSDGKKSVGGHVATPHPSKKDKSPKSATGPSCGPCKKTFNSQGALDSHTKAKHSATK